MTTKQANGITPKGKGWEWAQSFWIVFALIPWLSGMGFLYIALRTKRVRWAIWGVVYELPVLLYVLTDNMPIDAWQSDVALLALIVAIISATVQSFVVRKEVLLRLYAKKQQALQQEEMMKYGISKEYGVDMGDTERTIAQPAEQAVEPPQVQQLVAQVAAATTATATTAAPEQVEGLVAEGDNKRFEPIVAEPFPNEPESEQEGIVAMPVAMTPPPLPQEALAPTGEVAATGTVQAPPPPPAPSAPLPLATGDGLVDLNHATEEEIAALPGIGLIYAKRAVSEREAIGGFESLEQFGTTLGFKPHVLERIRPYVTLTPLKKESAPRTGRVVDV